MTALRLGQLIRLRRTRRGLSLAALSTQTGLACATLAALEDGSLDDVPSMALGHIARALQWSADFLLLRVEDAQAWAGRQTGGRAR